MMKYTYFIGIDVSKSTLDIAILDSSEKVNQYQIKNNLASISSFIEERSKELNSFDKSLFCLESTGVYSNHLLSYLTRYNYHAWVVNPVDVKRSMGMVRGKSDDIDALRIARFSKVNLDQLRLFIPPRKIILQLKTLAKIREQLVKVRTQLKQSLCEKDFESLDIIKIKKNAIQQSFDSLNQDIKDTEDKMDKLIVSDQKLNRIYQIACSVMGIGKVTAIEIIITTNEFKTIYEPKKLACHAGVAPFPNCSGSSLNGKNRVSKLANKKLKKLLHLAALSAIRYHCDIRLYYLRKVAEGKHKMSVLNAVRNKIINRLFA